MGQSKISRCFSVGELNDSIPLSGGFPSELILGKQIPSIKLNSFSELRRFSAWDTFHQTAASMLQLWLLTIVQRKLSIGRWQ